MPRRLESKITYESLSIPDDGSSSIYWPRNDNWLTSCTYAVFENISSPFLKYLYWAVGAFVSTNILWVISDSFPALSWVFILKEFMPSGNGLVISATQYVPSYVALKPFTLASVTVPNVSDAVNMIIGVLSFVFISRVSIVVLFIYLKPPKSISGPVLSIEK